MAHQQSQLGRKHDGHFQSLNAIVNIFPERDIHFYRSLPAEEVCRMLNESLENMSLTERRRMKNYFEEHRIKFEERSAMSKLIWVDNYLMFIGDKEPA